MIKNIIHEVIGNDLRNPKVTVFPVHLPHLHRYAQALQCFQYTCPEFLGSGEDSIAILFTSVKTGRQRVLKITQMPLDQWEDDWGNPDVYDYLCPVLGQPTKHRLQGSEFVSYVQPLLGEVSWHQASRFARMLEDDYGVHIWDAAGDKIVEQVGWLKDGNDSRPVLHDFGAIYAAA